MIPRLDIVSFGQVQEHRLTVLHIPTPNWPCLVSVSGYSHFAFKFSECYCIIFSISPLVEVFCILSISRRFEYHFSFKLNVLKLWYSLSKVIDLIGGRTFSSLKRLINQNIFFRSCRKWWSDTSVNWFFLFFLQDSLWFPIFLVKYLIWSIYS